MTEQEARQGVEQVCQQLGLTLKAFYYSDATPDPRGGRVLFDGAYVAIPPAYVLVGVGKDAVYAHNATVLMRVASGECETSIPIFGVPPYWTRWDIEAFLHPRLEEWVVNLMTGAT